MTRLFYGSTFLASLCAMTLIVGCGGSSSPGTTTCDGGNCSDAKGDTGSKLDGAKDTPAAKLDGPAPTPDGPAAVTHDGPVAVTPDGPVAVTPDGPVAVTPDGPVAVTPDGPPANLDVPPANLDVPPANLDVRPPDVTIGGQDVRPPDTITPPQTDAADAAADTTPVIHDAGSADSSADTTPVIIDAADAGPDGNVVIVVDAAADAGTDGTVVIVGDAGDGGVADAPEIDAPVVDGGSNDGPICEGDVCHAYTFEGNNLDGGPSLPTGFTAAGATGTWDLVLDGNNIVLQGTGGASSFAEATLPPATTTDETVQVNVRFTDATNSNNMVHICGRFTTGSTNAYCLEISTQAGDAGSTNGRMDIVQRNGSGLTTPATPATNLDIMVGKWHTYRFSIAFSAGPAVVLQGFLDGASTPTVSAADAPPTYTAGTVALGVRDCTAQFDNLITTP